MQDRSARRRSRTAAAVLAAVSLLGTAVLTGCDSGREGTTKGLPRSRPPGRGRSGTANRVRWPPSATPSPAASTPVRCWRTARRCPGRPAPTARCAAWPCGCSVRRGPRRAAGTTRRRGPGSRSCRSRWRRRRGEAGSGDGDDRRQRRLPGLRPVHDSGGRFSFLLRGFDASAAGRGAQGAGVRVERAGSQAALVDGARERAGQADLEAGDLPVDAGRRGRHGRARDGPARLGAGPGRGVQQGAPGGLCEGSALPLRRRGGLRLPVHRQAAQPVGLVPSGARRAGQAGGDRLPQCHRGPAPA